MFKLSKLRRFMVQLFWSCLSRKLIGQNWSMIAKSVLEPTVQRNEDKVSCSKETREAFDGVQTHNWPITSQNLMHYLLHHAQPPLYDTYK